MRKIYEIPGRKRIIVVSLFSGMDLFMLGFLKAGMLPGYACEWNFSACRMHMFQDKFKHTDGTPVMEPFIVITREEYDALRSNDDTKDTVGIVDGQFVRTKWIEEVNGRDIRAAIEARYGKDIIIVVVGGPPCQALTSLSARGRKGLKQVDTKQKNSRKLIFEFLRVMGELAEEGDNVLACMEQVPELGEKQYKEIYDEFIDKAKALPFNFAEQVMCSLHYGGNQNRSRYVMQFVHQGLNIQPTFPEPDTINVKRVKDFLPHVEHFFSGHFVDTIKNKNHFMCTVTKGSPAWLESKGQKWPPTEDELLLCFDVKKGDYLFPTDVSKDQRRQAIANAVCLSVSYALAKNMIDNMLGLKHIGNGYFIPKDAGSDPEGATVDTTPDEPQPIDGGNDGQISGSVTEDETPSDDQPVEVSKPEADSLTAVVTPVTIKPIASAPVKYFETGFELWRGKSNLTGEPIVAILTLHSQNAKTGDMAQLWILRADMNPLEAISEGKDDAICGNCSLRQNKGGACYVFVGQSPQAVWNAWKNDAYPKLPLHLFHNLRGRPVRIAAYGDPAAIPVNILHEIKKHTGNFTGYTHQWASETASDLKSLCMASVENPEEYQKANAAGWRTFRILAPGEELLPGEILCPNNTHGVQCKKCQLCRGTSRKAKNIAIPVHGSNKNKFKTVAAILEKAEAKPLPPLRNVIKAISDLSKDDYSSKIISSERLFEMEFDCLNFEDEWNELFGLPSVNFHLIIHGKSGHGKSTFAVQFAKYLADNFGKVLYVSGEEGFSKTLQNKFVNNDASAASLDIADVRSYDEFIRVVPRGSYNFIFLDSLDTMKIDTDKLRSIKQHYKNTAIITISQATKAGQMRGSYEIVHDSDIAVEVIDGMATTTKNRFKERGMTFNVFRQMNGTEEVDTQSGENKISKPLTTEARIEILTKRMFAAAAAEKYEEAAKLRNQIDRLQNLK